MLDMGRKARAGAATLRLASADTRTAALTAMASRVRAHIAAILAANAVDIQTAREASLSAAMLDRLALSPSADRGDRRRLGRHRRHPRSRRAGGPRAGPPTTASTSPG